MAMCAGAVQTECLLYADIYTRLVSAKACRGRAARWSSLHEWLLGRDAIGPVDEDRRHTRQRQSWRGVMTTSATASRSSMNATESMDPSSQRRLMPVVAVAACFLTLAILEFAVRLWDHQVLTTRNFVLDELALLHSQYPVQFDASLGWTPKANATGTAEMWGTTVGITILPDGTRSNGSQRTIANAHPVIVAVGDSFTFGDEVSTATRGQRGWSGS